MTIKKHGGIFGRKPSSNTADFYVSITYFA